jgi:hypothetical protein
MVEEEKTVQCLTTKVIFYNLFMHACRKSKLWQGLSSRSILNVSTQLKHLRSSVSAVHNAPSAIITIGAVQRLARLAVILSKIRY